jgi:hypothetical protein
MKKLLFICIVLLFNLSSKSQEYITSFKNSYIIFNGDKWVTKKENFFEITFTVYGNTIYASDLANSVYTIKGDGETKSDNAGKHIFFDAIDEDRKKCTIVLSQPFDDTQYHLFSVLYHDRGFVYFIKKYK